MHVNNPTSPYFLTFFVYSGNVLISWTSLSLSLSPLVYFLMQTPPNTSVHSTVIRRSLARNADAFIEMGRLMTVKTSLI